MSGAGATDGAPDGAGAALPDGPFGLRLHVAGGSPRPLAAIANLRRLCERRLAGCRSVEVIDLSRDPARAAADRIAALPTLVRRLPPPVGRVIGTLADADEVLLGLAVGPLP